jgi:hypothetical protein
VEGLQPQRTEHYRRHETPGAAAIQTRNVTCLLDSMPSSVIRAFSYDASRRELLIIFQSGRRYTYQGVPEETYTAMEASFAKGEFFNAEIRGRYSFVQADAQGSDTD